MQMKKTLMAVAATTALLAAGASQAASLDINLAGWKTEGGFGNVDNTEEFIDLGVDTLVTGFEYIGLAFTSQGLSWQSEFTLSLNNQIGSEYLDWSPSLADEEGAFGPASGSWGGANGGPGPFGAGAPFSLDDGILWVTVYEAFNDAGTDATVSAGTLRIFYQPIPEPSTYGLMALGLLGVGLAARRRRG